MYKVIEYFTDLHDKNHPYNVGDVFPRKGIEVKKERLAELSGKNNKQGRPLIKLIEENVNTEEGNSEPDKQKEVSMKK